MRILRARGGRIALDDGRAWGEAPLSPSSQLSVPIETPAGRIGEVAVYDKKRGEFSAADDKLIRALARQAGIALRNNELIAGLRVHNEELGRLNTELRVLDGLKDEFVSNVSHELRTPLASIKGFASTILSDPEMPPEVLQEFVGIIDTESDKLIVIINDILDIQRALSGSLALDLQRRPLQAVVARIIQLLTIQADDKGLTLDFECADEVNLPYDDTRLGQVFTNLIGNAIKFTDSGGVRVRQWVAEGEARVSIADTGIGIPTEALEQVFEKFFRVENVVHTKEGTGLGLSLVQSICARHGGRVEVDSTPGEGSVFTVHLPLEAS